MSTLCIVANYGVVAQRKQLARLTYPNNSSFIFFAFPLRLCVFAVKSERWKVEGFRFALNPVSGEGSFTGGQPTQPERNVYVFPPPSRPVCHAGTHRFARRLRRRRRDPRHYDL